MDVPAEMSQPQCSLDEDDDFNDLIPEDPTGEGDKAPCVAVNYKTSIDQYEKVDMFQTSSIVIQEPEPETLPPSHQTLPPSHQTSPPSHQTSANGDDPPTQQESQQIEVPKLDLSGLTGDSSSQPSDGSSTRLTISTLSSKTEDKDSGPSEPSLPNGASSTIATTEAVGEESSRPAEDILKTEVSRTAAQEPSEQLLRAQAEWDAVETIQPGLVSPGKHSVVRAAPLVSFNEALGFFQSRNMDPYLSKIKPCVERAGFAALRHLILGPPKVNRGLTDERNLVFAIAQYPFDDEEAIHKRVLQTIYKQLTGSTIDCPRYGSHWEQIGFQGTDPATDLRACGFLGLLTLLDFVMDSKKMSLAKDIYRLSQHETQNFPFSVMSINMTRIALQALREDHLSRECNKRKQVFGVVNDFYVSLFLQLYQTWKQQRKTIHDSGFVLKDLETNCKKNPKNMLRNLEVHLAERLARGGDTPRSGVTASPGRNKASMDFAGVHELEDQKG